MSFSSEVKNILASLQVKRNCCRKALLFGLLASHSDFQNQIISFSTDNEKVSSLMSWAFRHVYGVIPYYETSGVMPGVVSYYKMKPLEDTPKQNVLISAAEFMEGLKDAPGCDACLSCFLRGLFLAGGTVSDPNKRGYHLEILFKSEAVRGAVYNILLESGFLPKLAERKGSLSIYFKNSESIEDFLTVIGAPHAALDLMNAKIMREIRNNENRRSNCDASNIYRSTGAADVHLRAIRKLMDNGKISLLPGELKTTAMIRYQNPECSLSEIAALHEPPLTKSGVNHRMKRIVDFAEKN